MASRTSSERFFLRRDLKQMTHNVYDSHLESKNRQN